MDYMKFLKEKQKILKSMEDTVCLTMEEAEEICRIIRELEQYQAVGTVEEMQMLKATAFSDTELAKIREGLELLEKYKEVGTVEECHKSVEILKKMAKRNIVDNSEYGTCPRCGKEFNSELLEEFGIRACPWCGQRLERNGKA